MNAVEQRTAALSLANGVRIARSHLRREIAPLGYRDGLCHVAGLLNDPSEVAAGMRLDRLLTSIDRVGPAARAALLRRARVIPARAYRRVGELTSGERDRLALTLRERADRAKGRTT